MTEVIVSSPVLSPERPVQDFSQNTVLYGVALSAPEPVVEYSGESVIFNRRNMKVGEPHVFSFRAKIMIAVKRDDETIDFYYLP